MSEVPDDQPREELDILISTPTAPTRWVRVVGVSEIDAELGFLHVELIDGTVKSFNLKYVVQVDVTEL